MAYQCVITYTPHGPNKLLCPSLSKAMLDGVVCGGVFASLCRMPTCTTYLSSDGATMKHTSIHAPHSTGRPFFIYRSDSARVRSPRVSSIATHAQDCPGLTGSCFRLLPHHCTLVQAICLAFQNNNLRKSNITLG